VAKTLPDTVTTSELAKITGYTDRRVRQLAREGKLTRSVDESGKTIEGVFPFPLAVQQFIKVQKDQATDSDDEKELMALKKENLRIKNERDSLQLAVLKNEAHSANDVRQIFGEMVVTIRSRLQALPHLIAPQIHGKDSIPEIIAISDKAVNTVLLELKGYDRQEFAERSKEVLKVVVDRDNAQAATESDELYNEIYKDLA
jgi:hypothetical protein